MQRGFTLLEVMLVVAILLIIGAIGFQLLSTGNISWESANTSLTIEQEIRRGIILMAKELERSSPSTIVGVPADGIYYNSITFRMPQDNDGDGTIVNAIGNIEWSNLIVYQLTFNASLNSFQLIRTQGVVTRVLANYMPTAQSVRFRRTQSEPNILEINLQAQKGSSFGHVTARSITSRVLLRNP